jgi:integrase
MNTVIQLRPSQSEKPTVRGGRAKNAEYRQHEYLTEPEIDKLMASAGDGRNPVRDRLLILMAFRHALRVSELVDIRWQQIHLDTATVDIRRAKNGTPGIHGLQGDELRLLRALRREHPHADFVFLSERKAPLSVDGAQKLIERLGEAANLPFKIHAHMLRHAAGYALAARGIDTRTLQVFMGHLVLTHHGPSLSQQTAFYGQQGPRHPRPAGISRSLEYSAHGPLHRAGARSVRGLWRD